MLLPVKPKKVDLIIFPIKGRPILAGTGESCFTLFVPALGRLCIFLEKKHCIIPGRNTVFTEKHEAFCMDTKDGKHLPKLKF